MYIAIRNHTTARPGYLDAVRLPGVSALSDFVKNHGTDNWHYYEVDKALRIVAQWSIKINPEVNHGSV